MLFFQSSKAFRTTIISNHYFFVSQLLIWGNFVPTFFKHHQSLNSFWDVVKKIIRVTGVSEENAKERVGWMWMIKYDQHYRHYPEAKNKQNISTFFCKNVDLGFFIVCSANVKLTIHCNYSLCYLIIFYIRYFILFIVFTFISTEPLKGHWRRKNNWSKN